MKPTGFDQVSVGFNQLLIRKPNPYENVAHFKYVYKVDVC